ncbi:hypothetical protein CPB83DRAFT_132118 [Crepidotus variabilis]|uniref:Uncharacterized protein n=1 Tax=Crepidotus variabilis TaxID=179855 RepID=A0A9P6ELX1_9AGAR|nr:hypothetical protein CPB83DRAFT_132118 [Crepidotus variabilis]
MHFLVYLLTFSFSLALVSAQSDAPGPTTAACTFSCPVEDVTSSPLAVRQYAIPHDSYYSVIECNYVAPNVERTCFYDKQNGIQRLGATEDGCPLRAVPCSNKGPEPGFSDPAVPEVPSWVTSGRDHLWFKEHYRV